MEGRGIHFKFHRIKAITFGQEAITSQSKNFTNFKGWYFFDKVIREPVTGDCIWGSQTLSNGEKEVFD